VKKKTIYIYLKKKIQRDFYKIKIQFIKLIITTFQLLFHVTINIMLFLQIKFKKLRLFNTKNKK